jgi:hypothetical protein
MALDIKTAEDLMDRDFEARWAARRQGPQAEVLRWIVRALIERGRPIPVADVEAAFPATHSAVRDEVMALDTQDLIVIMEGEITLAYPLSATPTPFVVSLQDGRERFACCAVDALGIAAMLGERIGIRAPCHHCGEVLELAADPTGPLSARDIMVWVGQREPERRACTSL